jgi:flagellar motor switch/type III secretory pathway protein FliN
MSPGRLPESVANARVGPYPWQSLCSVPRETVGLVGDARLAAVTSVDLSGLGRVIGEVVGRHVRVLVPHVEVVTEAPAPTGICLAFESSDRSLQIDTEVDRDLAVTLVAAVIGRRSTLANPRATVDAEIEGALAAVGSTVLRRAHGTNDSLRLVGPGTLRHTPGERLLRLHATVLVEDDAYGARVTVRASPAAGAPRGVSPKRLLTSLGHVAVSVPVVAATSLAQRSEIDTLLPGDVFFAGTGWTIALSPGGGLSGTVTLTAPAHDRGIVAKLGAAGDLVVVGLGASPLDTETAMDDSKADDGGISEAVLHAPLVVRVELGAVTLTAREWAALGPGDVVALGKRVAEPAVLRVAGVEVAKGDLVEIEGELGVRIRELTREEQE